MSPVSSVESWFFSSLGWKVPMPMRSFSLSTRRRTRTWFSTIFAQSPWYFVISPRKMKRLAGSRSPSTCTLKCGCDRFSWLIARERHACGMSRSGSSCMGESNMSPSALETRLDSARFTHLKVYSAPSGVAE